MAEQIQGLSPLSPSSTSGISQIEARIAELESKLVPDLTNQIVERLLRNKDKKNNQRKKATKKRQKVPTKGSGRIRSARRI